jgi:hypothetical protein
MTATLATRGHSASAAVRLPHSRYTEHVVFRYDRNRSPSISYHSMPHGCTGAAHTLLQARQHYRSTMTRLLGVSRDELPPMDEYMEAAVAGMWVRDKIGAVHRDPFMDRMFLDALMSAGPVQDAVRTYVEERTCRGANPVVALAEPDDTVGSVLDQMRPEDTLVVAFPEPADGIGWIAICGSRAARAHDAVPLIAGTKLRAMEISLLTRRSGTAKAMHVQPV